MIRHEPVSLPEARAAAHRIEGIAVRTPLIRLPDAPPGTEVWLKLENLQPIRSFKLRGAASMLMSLPRARLERGVWVASAGNMAQGVAWCARHLDVECTVVVPEGAPQVKHDAIERLGARVVAVPFEDWFRIYETRAYPGMDGVFVHAFSDPQVMAGNATIGLELMEELEDFGAIVIPYGGGGLSCGIASVVRAERPETRVYAVEVDTAAPLTAAFMAGERVDIEHRRSFVDGIGGPCLFEEMWQLARALLDGAEVVTLEEVAAAMRALVQQNAIVAEGAAAAAVAAALAGRIGAGRIVCVVSGGNVDASVLSTILDGRLPETR